MMEVLIYRNWQEGLPKVAAREEFVPRIRVEDFHELDKSDPLNQQSFIIFKVPGNRFAARAEVDLSADPNGMRAMAALLEVAVHHAAEIRDALGVET